MLSTPKKLPENYPKMKLIAQINIQVNRNDRFHIRDSFSGYIALLKKDYIFTPCNTKYGLYWKTFTKPSGKESSEVFKQSFLSSLKNEFITKICNKKNRGR